MRFPSRVCSCDSFLGWDFEDSGLAVLSLGAGGKGGCVDAFLATCGLTQVALLSVAGTLSSGRFGKMKPPQMSDKVPVFSWSASDVSIESIIV